MFMLQSAGILVVFVTCVVERVLWWLCCVSECDVDHLLVILWVVHKCGFVLVVSMGGLRG